MPARVWLLFTPTLSSTLSAVVCAAQTHVSPPGTLSYLSPVLYLLALLAALWVVYLWRLGRVAGRGQAPTTPDPGAEHLADLPGVLLQLGEAMASIHDLPFHFTLGGSSHLKLLPGMRSDSYTIVREAVIHAFGHAGVSRVHLDIHFGASALTFAVRNNGKSIDAHSANPGFNLCTLHDRTARLGGTLEARQTSAGDSAIVLTIPAQHAYVKPPRQINWRAALRRAGSAVQDQRPPR
ncbi:hypothetical protein [Silvimonas iriomotensis]|uniref:Histidine kinase n=1 Tax=Silvimonas iriomotensis TaxID=449662 RepID=A0ABQ2P5T7_9NEIS|nr:hypothetical protein [Silvimonas iriomotensis]GGP18945.1 hypothetical protein GCM10010970_08170 [Silvimonas iriomotensis]